MKKVKIEITLNGDEVEMRLENDGASNFELVGLLDYAKYRVNKNHFENYEHGQKSKN